MHGRPASSYTAKSEYMYEKKEVKEESWFQGAANDKGYKYTDKFLEVKA